MGMRPTETILIGQWRFSNGKIVADDVCQRISDLTSSHLKKIGADASGWNVLYQDPNDSRFWEFSYPNSHMHGGGPPQLKNITREQAQQHYGVMF